MEKYYDTDFQLNYKLISNDRTGNQMSCDEKNAQFSDLNLIVTVCL